VKDTKQIICSNNNNLKTTGFQIILKETEATAKTQASPQIVRLFKLKILQRVEALTLISITNILKGKFHKGNQIKIVKEMLAV